MNPSNHLPMNEVVEMCEGDLESLKLPPKPVLFPEAEAKNDSGDYPDENWSSTVSADYIESK
uniref:Uncharacterized protein MANES_14G017400 n=1 Tax=Rhizophora mucronata TaxID=61149 RepID=A0A2P2Q579_RHIMU